MTPTLSNPGNSVCTIQKRGQSQTSDASGLTLTNECASAPPKLAFQPNSICDYLRRLLTKCFERRVGKPTAHPGTCVSQTVWGMICFDGDHSMKPLLSRAMQFDPLQRKSERRAPSNICKGLSNYRNRRSMQRW